VVASSTKERQNAVFEIMAQRSPLLMEDQG